MKKLLTAICIVALSASIVEARPHGGFHHHEMSRRPEHHQVIKQNSDDIAIASALTAGIIGIVFIANLLSPSNN